MRITLEFPFVVDHLKVQQQVRDELLKELGAKLTAAELEGLDLSFVIVAHRVVVFKTDVVDATVPRS